MKFILGMIVGATIVAVIAINWPVGPRGKNQLWAVSEYLYHRDQKGAGCVMFPNEELLCGPRLFPIDPSDPKVFPLIQQDSQRPDCNGT